MLTSVNKLDSWIKARFADEKDVLNLLQEYGVISDNCINVGDVGNDLEAMKFMARNFEHLQKYKV